jgi:hypothetical protein
VVTAKQEYTEAKEREHRRKLAILKGEQAEAEQAETNAPARLGHFMADLTEDYTSEDMVGLTDAEVELLAVRFKQQTKDAMFGTPDNPFVAELRSRAEARAELQREKAEIKKEIKAKPTHEKGLLADLFLDEPKPKGKQGKGKGLIQGLFED